VIAAAEGLDDIFVGNARLVLLVARSLAAEGQGDEALALLKKANAENPDDFSLRRWAGRLAAQHGDYATALRMYSSLDKRDPEFPSAKRDVERFFAGVELRGVRKLRELLDSDQIDAALDLAHELSARTGAGEACERFLTRKHRSLRVRLIEIEQGEGDLDEREPILAQMLRIKAEDEFALRRLALEFTRQFRFAEAAECWERVHELDPDSETAIRNRDRCRVLAQRKTSISKAA
jgi:tetratricopeptide (TPR) repeat protein